jgi:hypothetical protein
MFLGVYRLDDTRVMELVLMKLVFPQSTKHSGVEASDDITPVFSRVTEWKTVGVIMNIFLLCPPERLLSAFRWLSTTNTIALYVLLDWDKDEYTFIDTGIECVSGTDSFIDPLSDSCFNCSPTLLGCRCAGTL